MSGYSAVGSHTTEPVLERLLMMKQETFVFKIPPGLIHLKSFYFVWDGLMVYYLTFTIHP